MIKYTQLSAAERLVGIRARIRDIEQQYMNLSLRIQAPDTSAPLTVSSDNDHLARLEASLAKLHEMEATLDPSVRG